MPIVKKDEIMPERPVIIVLYGTAGTGKTSSCNTAKNPLLIDCDKGASRAANSVDTLMANKWEDIEAEYPTMKEYDTIVCDTAKSLIDDFLATYVVDKNYKLATNTLKRFAEMGEQFKLFVNQLRQNKSDIIFICHDKETAEGDIIKHSPDCTGQSKDLLLRIADQVGYLTMVNNKRTIVFSPTDTSVGKDVAELKTVIIPDCGTPQFETFMADIIDRVKKSIFSKTEAQKKANEALKNAKEQLEAVSTVEEANAMIAVRDSLAKIHQKGFSEFMITELAKKGFTLDKKTKTFVSDETGKSDPA